MEAFLAIVAALINLIAIALYHDKQAKFDGWRAQLHKDGDAVTIFSRNGREITGRFKSVRDSLAEGAGHSGFGGVR